MQRREITPNERKAMMIGGFIFFGIVIVGGSILLGRSDKGVIDVSAAIQNANQQRREAATETGEKVKDIAVPNAQTAGKPNGGLVGTGKPTPPPPPPEPPASSTASSTEDGTQDEEIENTEDTESAEGTEATDDAAELDTTNESSASNEEASGQSEADGEVVTES